MSISNSEAKVKNLADDAYQRLEKDVSTVKDDIAALTRQITDALNTFAGQAGKKARANVDSALDEATERGTAMLGAAQDVAVSIEETLEDVITQRPLATVGLALGLGFLVGITWRR